MEAAEVAAVVGRVAERLYAEDYDEHEGIAEESVAEVMSWLELEIRLAAGAAAVLPQALPPPTPPGAAVVGRVAEERLCAEDYEEHEGIAEESVAEVMMSWLDLEIRLAAGAAVLPLPPRPPTPPGAALYATVGGGRESCGSSLSGPASTVMASVDGRAGAPPPPAVPWPWPFPESVAGNDDGDEDDADDEWVSQLLTEGPAVEGLWGSQ